MTNGNPGAPDVLAPAQPLPRLPTRPNGRGSVTALALAAALNAAISDYLEAGGDPAICADLLRSLADDVFPTVHPIPTPYEA